MHLSAAHGNCQMKREQGEPSALSENRASDTQNQRTTRTIAAEPHAPTPQPADSAEPLVPATREQRSTEQGDRSVDDRPRTPVAKAKKARPTPKRPSSRARGKARARENSRGGGDQSREQKEDSWTHMAIEDLTFDP